MGSRKSSTRTRRSVSKKSSTRRAVSKKSSTRRAVSKKSSTRRAVSKKSSRRVVSKKSSTRRAVSKKSTRRAVSKKSSTRRAVSSANKNNFELQFHVHRYLDLKSDPEDIYDVSSLPSNVKDVYRNYLQSLPSTSLRHPNRLTIKSISFGKKPYISVKASSEYPLNQNMGISETLLDWIEQYDNKSIFQDFGKNDPTHDGWRYKLISVKVK